MAIRTGCAVMASSLIVAGLLGPAPAIADTGMEDDVAQVEFGALEDASFSEVYDAIRETVVAKLRISNPRHLLPEDR